MLANLDFVRAAENVIYAPPPDWYASIALDACGRTGVSLPNLSLSVASRSALAIIVGSVTQFESAVMPRHPTSN